MELNKIQKIEEDEEEERELYMLLNSFDSGSTVQLSPRKQKYLERIKSSAFMTLGFMSIDDDISKDKIDAVAAELAGKRIEKLKLPKNLEDLIFGEIALRAAKKVKYLGGGEEEMISSALSVLTCRYHNENGGKIVTDEQIEEFANVVAMQTVANDDKNSVAFSALSAISKDEKISVERSVEESYSTIDFDEKQRSFIEGTVTKYDLKGKFPKKEREVLWLEKDNDNSSVHSMPLMDRPSSIISATAVGEIMVQAEDYVLPSVNADEVYGVEAVIIEAEEVIPIPHADSMPLLSIDDIAQIGNREELDEEVNAHKALEAQEPSVHDIESIVDRDEFSHEVSENPICETEENDSITATESKEGIVANQLQISPSNKIRSSLGKELKRSSNKTVDKFSKILAFFSKRAIKLNPRRITFTENLKSETVYPAVVAEKENVEEITEEDESLDSGKNVEEKEEEESEEGSQVSSKKVLDVKEEEKDQSARRSVVSSSSPSEPEEELEIAKPDQGAKEEENSTNEEMNVLKKEGRNKISKKELSAIKSSKTLRGELAAIRTDPELVNKVEEEDGKKKKKNSKKKKSVKKLKLKGSKEVSEKQSKIPKAIKVEEDDEMNHYTPVKKNHEREEFSTISGTANLNKSLSVEVFRMFQRKQHSFSKAFSPQKGKSFQEKSKQLMYSNTDETSHQIPQIVYTDEIDVSTLLSLQGSLTSSECMELAAKSKILPFIIKAASLALKQYPVFNSLVDPKTSTIVKQSKHNIGIAMDSQEGLIAPVLRNCQKLSISQIAAEINGYESGSLPNDNVQGTFLLCNIGSHEAMTPIILPPQVCSASIGKIQRVPRFLNEASSEVRAVSIMSISVAVDRRAVDIATLARFCDSWKMFLEDPARMVLDLK